MQRATRRRTVGFAAFVAAAALALGAYGVAAGSSSGPGRPHPYAPVATVPAVGGPTLGGAPELDRSRVGELGRR